MKKIKQIIAILGVILLLGLYAVTLIMAFTDNTQTMSLFEASIIATIMVPILIWAYSFIYKLLKKHYGLNKDTSDYVDGDK